MPNHITQTLKFENTKDYNTLRELLAGEKAGEIVDFNKITPMPESLMSGGDPGSTAKLEYMIVAKIRDVASESDISNMVKRYIKSSEFRIPAMFKGTNTNDPENVELEAENIIQLAKDKYNAGKYKNKDFVKPFENGKIYLESFEKYGYTSWYSWSVDHWGTKWNAYDAELNPDNLEIIYHTAWAPAAKVMQKAHIMTDNTPFEMHFIDEGGPSGIYTYIDGDIIVEIDEYEEINE